VNIAPAVGFGVGAALLLDEFALVLYLRDVYWSDEGRGSIYAVIVMGLVVGMIALPLAPGQLSDQSRPIVIATAAVYILLTAVCLAKGKVFTCMLGLFVPPVVVYGAVRLARPDSPWARLFYGPRKLARTRRRYRPTKTRERRRQQVLDLIERVETSGEVTGAWRDGLAHPSGLRR
jgi:lysyl-tRNA synthetase class 2